MGSVARLAVALLAVTSAALVATGGSRAGFPASNERLVYTSESLFGVDTWAVDPSGGPALQFATPLGIGVDGAVSVAPNGTKLAYTDTVGLDIPGLPPSVRSQQPTFPILEFAPIAFDVANGALGGISTILTNEQQLGTVYSRPAWSPDGTRLVISSGIPGHLHLYFVDAAGSPTPTLLTDAAPGDSVDARWSPDGSWIAFTARDDTSSQLYLVHPDGTGLHKLSDGTARDEEPDFSPDSQHVVFASNRTGTWQLYTVPVTGGTPTRLVSDAGDDTRPAWSPDGKWIAYTNDDGVLHAIELVDPSGGNEHQVTTSSGHLFVQDWQPLLHTGNPTVHAYPSTGKRGGPVVLRYRASDSVPLSVQFSYEVSSRNGSSGGESNSIDLAKPASEAIRTFRVDKSSLPTLGRATKPPTSFRFCVRANDPWGNTASSCSAYRITGK